jgi:hypothetical protein
MLWLIMAALLLIAVVVIITAARERDRDEQCPRCPGPRVVHQHWAPGARKRLLDKDH